MTDPPSSRTAFVTGARCVVVTADVTDAAAVARAAAKAQAALGPVDLLVNGAGLIESTEVPVWEADPDEWSGRMRRAGVDDVPTLLRLAEQGLPEGARTLRLRPYGPEDPLG